MKLIKTQSLYVIYNPELNLTKIGISANVHERLKTLSFMSGCELELYHVTKPITNAHEIETKMHHHFKDSHKIGEWFKVDPRACSNYVETLNVKQDRITELYDKGESISRIADKFGVSRQAIIKRLQKYKPYKKEQRDKQNKKMIHANLNRVTNINDFERIGKNKYKHKKTNQECTIKYTDGQFQIIG